MCMSLIKAIMSQNLSTNRGFTLFLTILVIGVVLAVTLTSLNLAIKQVQLSADTRDSEVAFQAANAGLECVRHWRRAERGAFESGDSVPINCFGSGDISPSNLDDSIVFTGEGSVYLYEYQIPWGDAGFGERCSQMRFVVMTADIDGGGMSISNEDMRDALEGYPQRDDPTECEAGGRCTAFLSQGYSTSCPSSINDSFPLGTIQREILVEF